MSSDVVASVNIRAARLHGQGLRLDIVLRGHSLRRLVPGDEEHHRYRGHGGEHGS